MPVIATEPAKRHRWLGDLPPMLIFLACSLLLHREALVGHRLYTESDTYEFYAPLARLFADALHSGHIPWWTSMIYGGYPLFADGETAMVYPPNLLAYGLLPANVAFVLLRILAYVVASATMYVFGRVLGRSRWAATIAGLSFGFGSYSIGQMQHVNLLACAAWLPLVLASLERAIQTGGTRRCRACAVAGLAIGLQALTPHSAVLIISALTAAGYMLLRLVLLPNSHAHLAIPAGRTRAWLAVRLLATGGGIGACIGAVQLLPLAALAAQSQRGQGVTYAYATSFSFPPPNLVTLLFPYFFRGGDGTYWSPWFRWDTTMYAGVVPVVFATFAVVTCARRSCRDRRVVALALLGATGLLLSFGDMTPLKLYGVLWHLPLLSSQRAPSRYLLLPAIALAGLASFGADAFRNRIADRYGDRGHGAGNGWWPPVALIVVTGVIGILLEGARGRIQRSPEIGHALLLAPYRALGGQQIELHAPIDALPALLYSLRITSRWTGCALLLLLATAAGLALWRAFPHRGAWWQTALVVLTACDLLVIGSNFHPTATETAIWGLPPAGEVLLAAQPAARHYTRWPAAETAPDKLAPFGLADAAGYTSLEPAAHAALLPALQQFRSTSLDVLAVRYTVQPSRAPLQNGDAGDVIYHDADVVVGQRPGEHPRAWIVTNARPVADQRAALAAVVDGAVNISTTVLLEMPTIPEASSTPPQAAPPTVTVLSDRGDALAIAAETVQDAWLVVADLWYPGWSVTVDGEQREVYRANGVIRAVRLPAGNHRVEFRYHERWLPVGGILSVIGIAMCGSLAHPWRRTARVRS